MVAERMVVEMVAVEREEAATEAVPMELEGASADMCPAQQEDREVAVVLAAVVKAAVAKVVVEKAADTLVVEMVLAETGTGTREVVMLDKEVGYSGTLPVQTAGLRGLVERVVVEMVGGKESVVGGMVEVRVAVCMVMEMVAPREEVVAVEDIHPECLVDTKAGEATVVECKEVAVQVVAERAVATLAAVEVERKVAVVPVEVCLAVAMEAMEVETRVGVREVGVMEGVAMEAVPMVDRWALGWTVAERARAK
jgi:hypothetical protein